jgi:hypothetical protein
MPYPSLVFAPRPSARASLIRLYISLVHRVSMERDATKKSKVAPGLTTGKTRGRLCLVLSDVWLLVVRRYYVRLDGG